MAKVLYWLAVVALSLALVVGLVLFLESRDRPELGDAGSGQPVPEMTTPTLSPPLPLPHSRGLSRGEIG